MGWLSKLFGMYSEDDDMDVIPEEKEDVKSGGITTSQTIIPRVAMIESKDEWKKRPEERPQRGVIEIFVATNISEVKHCADSIKAGKSIIINYREIPLEEGRKFFTFMKGCIQALDWQCIRISTNIFLYTTDKNSIRKTISNVPDFSNTLQHSWDKPLR